MTDEQIDAIARRQDDDDGGPWFTRQITKLEWRAFARDILAASSAVQPQGQAEPVADADIKAAFVASFSSSEKWLGEAGSWFIEGFRAARPVPAAQPVEAASQAAGQAVPDLIAAYDAFDIGIKARTIDTLMMNIQNARRRSDCLWAIEREFFTVETPPEPEDGDEPGEECLLNWGVDPAEYVEQFRAALARINGEGGKGASGDAMEVRLRTIMTNRILSEAQHRQVVEALCEARDSILDVGNGNFFTLQKLRKAINDMQAASPAPTTQEPDQRAAGGEVAVAWARAKFILNSEGASIGIDDPEMSWGDEPPDEHDWIPLFGAADHFVDANKMVDGVLPTDGMDGNNIARRIERWFVEGLHSGNLSACPYAEMTLAERWWRRGCNSSVRMKLAKADTGMPGERWLEKAVELAEEYACANRHDMPTAETALRTHLSARIAPVARQSQQAEGFFTPDGRCINTSFSLGHLGIAPDDERDGCTIRRITIIPGEVVKGNAQPSNEQKGGA